MPPVVVMPLVLSPLVYLSGHWMAKLARMVTLAALGCIWLLFALAAFELSRADAGVVIYRQGMIAFAFDGLSLLVSAVALLLATLVTLYSGPDVVGMESEEKYYAMLLMMTGAVIGLVSAGDLFNLWLWFEMTAISSYLLVAFYRDRTDSLAACAKYLIQTATGSIVVLFGIALVFAETGTLDLAQIHISSSPLMVVAGALFIMGFGVKFALVPNYTWLPDAYAQAPTGISAMLSGIVTITGLAALLRVLAVLSGLSGGWGAVLIGFGTLNIVIGNLLALRQDEVKRIFAYSSISHIGFIVLAVGIGLYAQEYSGFYSGMLHLTIHAFMKALAFLAVGAALYARADRRVTLRVGDLRGLAGREPLVSFALIIACLSLAGVPPLGGFMSKLQIFLAGLESGSPALAALMVFAALNSVFSLAYYFPIINALFQPGTGQTPFQRQTPTVMRLPMIVLTAAILVLGVAPGLLDGFIIPASHTLMRFFGG